MKGDPISGAAAAADLIAGALDELGASSEVLGFSTAGWHGGKARAQWLLEGRQPRPGRLCALMHVIYKQADERGLDEAARDVIVHPDLLRENVDGEAIKWAISRLRASPRPQKLLLVISDGAPVDDSTLLENGGSYLWRHLQKVLIDARADPSLTLGAVGINYRVNELYPLSEHVYAPVDIAPAAANVVALMLAAAKEKAGFPRSLE